MKKTILPLLLSSLFLVNLVSAQNSCGTYDGYLQDEMEKYPDFYKSLEERNATLAMENEKLVSRLSEKENTGDLKIIPVVVHVIHEFGVANVTDADVAYALDQLNKNINRQADNMLTTPDVFAAVSGSANVEFRLATIAPDSTPTNGIIRIESSYTNVPSGVGNNVVKSLSYWNSYSYFNIWVVTSFPPQSDGNTLLGYAQFPWSGAMSTDGVAIRAIDFKQGKTLTHEVGHWLGLRHIWGDALCGDDGIHDTPAAKEENWGVPVSAFPYNLNTCEADSINPSGEMFMNYMDYSDDNVMSLFTDAQVVKINETLEGTPEQIPYRKYLWSEENVANTGTANGFVATACNKNPEFFEEYTTTPCLGDLNAFKGNKNIFTNITDITWDFGDGNSNTTGDNTPQYTYSSAGVYDVSLSITYTDDIVTKAFSMDDIESGYTSLETINETKWIEGTMEELNAVNAYDPILYMDLDSFSSNSYWVYAQPTDSVVGASTINALGIDTFLITYILSDGDTLPDADLLHLQTAYSYWVVDSTLVNGENQVFHFAEFIDNSFDAYFIDTLFYRGKYDETYYLAHYETTCTANTTKEGYITVLDNISSNNNGSYTYSFEGSSDLEDNFIIHDNNWFDADWDFNVVINPYWERIEGVSSVGDASIMLNGKKLTSGDPIVFETHSYDLSDLNEPAIKFDFIGAASTSNPSNKLKIYYSKECGIWKDLATISPKQLASAGFYDSPFKPTNIIWNDTIMYDRIGSNDLRSENVRFKFEYLVSSSSNRLYIDNIRIGEETELMMNNDNSASRLALSLYPNPASESANVIFENKSKRNIEVKLFNILGSEVLSVNFGKIEEGFQSFNIDLSFVDQGVYFISVNSEGVPLESTKMIIQ
jgi:hypothetical protein